MKAIQPIGACHRLRQLRRASSHERFHPSPQPCGQPHRGRDPCAGPILARRRGSSPRSTLDAGSLHRAGWRHAMPTIDSCQLITKDYTVLEVMQGRRPARGDTLSAILRRKLSSAVDAAAAYQHRRFLKADCRTRTRWRSWWSMSRNLALPIAGYIGWRSIKAKTASQTEVQILSRQQPARTFSSAGLWNAQTRDGPVSVLYTNIPIAVETFWPGVKIVARGVLGE